MATFYLKKTQWWLQDTWRSLVGSVGQEKDVIRNYDELDEDYDESGDGPRPTRSAVDRCLMGCPCQTSTRFVVALFASFGLLISFGLRCNISVAVVQMTTNRTTVTPDGGNKTEPEFDWPPGVRAVVDSSFLYGYFITQIPGGYLASRYPANRIFGAAIACTAFLNMFIPTACKMHYIYVVILRMCQGLVEGVTYPATHGIWRYWAPPLERSRLATITFCGSYAGAVVGMPLSGLLTGSLGWEAPFYVYGAFGLMWFIMWTFVGYEKPCKHPRISEEERMYIEKKINENTSVISNKLLKTPWKAFFTSLPVYAIIVANFCRSWSFYLLITSQPKYFKDVLQFNINKSALLSALPHLMMTVIVPIGGHTADMLRRKEILSTTTVRKVFNCGGFGMEAVFLLGVAFSQSTTVALTCLTLAVGMSGFAISGFNVNHLDIAPRYASILMGLSNGVGTLSGICCTVTTELLTKERSREEWETVFLIASLVHFLGVIFYGIFASGEKQSWADPTPEEEERRKSLHSIGASMVSAPTTPGKMTSYGATTDSHMFQYGGTIDNNMFQTKEEFVQVEAKGDYLNGDIKDRDM